jgi:Tfp pilus assembly protein PilX
MSPLHRPHCHHQRGAALATALLFLIVLTLLGIGAIREASTSLTMADNDASRINAIDTSQSLIDALLADTETHFPVTLVADLQMGCYPAGLAASNPLHAPFACADGGLTPPSTPSDALADRTYVEIWRESVNGQALVPATSIGTTGTTARVRYARFRITAGTDRSAVGQGAAEIQQGVQIGVPEVEGISQF